MSSVRVDPRAIERFRYESHWDHEAPSVLCGVSRLEDGEGGMSDPEIGLCRFCVRYFLRRAGRHWFCSTACANAADHRAGLK